MAEILYANARRLMLKVTFAVDNICYVIDEGRK